MAVKDRSKPIRHIQTGKEAKYLGVSCRHGIKLHVVQISLGGTVLTSWRTDEDFERLFENIPDEQPRVDPTKPIRLREGGWSGQAIANARSVECLWSVDVNGQLNHFVRIDRYDGRCKAGYWKDAAFQAAFENIPEDSPVAVTATLNGEKLPRVKSVEINCDNGAAPNTSETNGKSQPEIDWAGEVEIWRDEKWVPFELLCRDERWPNHIFGKRPGYDEPNVYYVYGNKFRNKPKPEPKWESAGDDRSCHEMDTGLWQVWAQYPDGHKGIKFPFVVHTGKSRIAGLGFLINLRDGGAFPPGMRFALAPCKAPKMPEAVEAE